MNMIYVTRKESFNAAHRLYNPALSDERNRQIYGPCANDNWHGHNFEIFVTVRGAVDPNTGLVIDLRTLSQIIKKGIVEKVDHKNLNMDVDFLKGVNPSCEVLVEVFWRILTKMLADVDQSVELHCIKLIETAKNYVEYYGINEQ